MTKAEQLRDLAACQILVKDGAYGTMIQREKLDEVGYRGDLDLAKDQKGNNDLINLTQPDVVRKIARGYAEAGAHILATNTFNANAISLADYGCEHLTAEINRRAAKLTHEVAAEVSAQDGKPRFVAGAIGPTNKTLSLSPDVEDPGYREIDYDHLLAVYREQCDALIAGGADFLLVETVFDTLNAKCAGMAACEAAAASGRDVPLMISMTLTDLSGRNLSGHTVEAFWHAVRHLKPVTIGLNCSFGAAQLRPHLVTLSRQADALIMAYPNAGLPNELGEYDETADQTAAQIAEWLEDGLVNVVGGCCGTTPEHIAAIAAAVEGRTPRALPAVPVKTRLAGLEPFSMAA